MSLPAEPPRQPAWWARLAISRWQRWVKRRLPPARAVTLTQRRLFIFPSAAGFAFLGMLLVMLVTAINYQNNMAYALTFLLGCVFVVAVHHTFANLHRLTLRAVGAESAFPGQQVAFSLQLTAPSRRHYRGIALGWDAPDIVTDVAPGTSQTVTLYRAAPDRGWFTPGKCLLETRYPLGLLRCWTWLDLELAALIYPRPIAPPVMPRTMGDDAQGVLAARGAGEDVADFRDYRAGDSLRAVNWRAWAKGQPLTTRVYGEPTGDARWLDFAHFDSGGTEERLSWLCALVLSASAASEPFGLRLPGREIPIDSGDAHRDAALRALALHGLAETA